MCEWCGDDACDYTGEDELEDTVFGLDEDDDPVCLPDCCECHGPTFELGTLGNRTHYRCRNCGADQSVA